MLSEHYIELIFRTFARRFTHRWKINHDDLLARHLWHRDLSREEITDAMVVDGLKACTKLKWPPSIGEFIEFCLASNKPINASHRPIEKLLPRPPVDLEKHNQRMIKLREVIA